MNNAKNLSIAALVCGIVGIVGAFIPVVNYVSWVLPILGIIFGVKARKICEPSERGMATAGMVLGIVGTAVGVLMVVCALCVVGAAMASGITI